MTPPTSCARHPDIAAAGTCERCGDFYCDACGDARHPGVCVRCGARLPSGLAWEDRRAGAWPIRFLVSAWQLTRRPQIAFPGPARAGRAIGFAALCGLGLGVVLVAMAAVLSLDPTSYVRLRLEESTATFAAAMGIALALPVLVTVLWSAAQAVSFAVGLASAGRRAGVFRVALRACAYAQIVLLLLILAPFAGAVIGELEPTSTTIFVVVRVLWVASCGLWPVLTGRVCYWAGRGVGLPASRAAFAALGPALMCVPIAAYVSNQQLEMLEAPQLYVPAADHRVESS